MKNKDIFKYDFSIVMSAYNTKDYIKEAINSVINQDLGFKGIQLIIVDDGSTDNTGAIINEYYEKYPNNVKVIYKKNGGTSSARNEGIKHVEGKYINFLDSDDKLGRNVLRKVKKFFDQNYNETDIVCLPVYFFGKEKGEHYLNNKFKKGSRIIDLNKEWKVVHKQISSSFIKKETIDEGFFFDERTSYGEDMKLILQILYKKQKMGVVSNAKYYYRRRETNESLIQKSTVNKKWYIPCMQYTFLDLLQWYQDKNNCIPKYVQNTLCSDLQWHVMEEKIPYGILTKKEENEYLGLIKKALMYIDNDVILAQSQIDAMLKLSLLKLKKTKLLKVNDCIKDNKNNLVYNLRTDGKIIIDFIELRGKICNIEGRYITINEDNNIKISIDCDNKTDYEKMEYYKEINSVVYKSYAKIYSFTIKRAIKKDNRYKVSLSNDILFYEPENIQFGKYVSLSHIFNKMYFYNQDYIVSFCRNRIIFNKFSIINKNKKELQFILDLLTTRTEKRLKTAAYKSILIRPIISIAKKLKKREIWLFRDRLETADDNGLALFEYFNGKNKKINSVFAISKKSKDYKKIQKIGKVIDSTSWKYKIYYLISDYVLSSSADDDAVRPFMGHNEPFKDLERGVKRVFLQHGIIENDLSNWLNKYEMNFYGFVCSSKKEKESLLEKQYKYNENCIWLTGSPRYDKLYNKKEKNIIIAPTWRSYLLGKKEKSDHRELISGFKTSNYYQTYNRLINNKRFVEFVNSKGYKIIFFSHPTFKEHSNLLENNQKILIDPEISYRELLAKGSILVTDYSSVAFDFAYLKKPILYFQFDKKEFYSNHETCNSGYFSFSRDGFGEIEKNSEDLINQIIKYIENDCKMKDKYKKRVEKFFAFNDFNNCARVIKMIENRR